ncbi:hypothetical protein B2G71_07465 [Novosphingobium sp. PC22D]|uniref:DUF2332 domain-containing protein n=1 Tax=Novosphingobium sp. PC22D TaxID=1962403 RepID=UPI000BEF42CB|nr:DUF2332 domain-containing protein [Novosphingobium sp. PC22D]PEQ13269.1 hypothetical protein B2G71_07465 [Novosphingobium sp. PC22D]
MAQADSGDSNGFEGGVAQAYANQVAYCEANGAPVTARVVAAIARQLGRPGAGPFIERIAAWQGQALADGLPLRSAAAVHGLHLSGTAPELAPIYAGRKADDDVVIGALCRTRAARMLPWLDGPPQTNEAGRSSNFVAAMLWLADRGLPPRFACREIGSSAGINLMIDRYRYDLGGVAVGPRDAAMAFTPEWRGPPPPSHPITFESLRGCDVAPVDLTDPDQALRLKSYIWPEHHVRFERLEAAIAAAGCRRPDLAAMNAADFVEAELAMPQEAGTTRVLMHSIVWQYVPADEQERVTRAMEAAGAAATADRALAWIAVEADRSLLGHRLTVRYWPGGEAVVELAAAHAHGAWIEWRGTAAR